MPCVYLKFTLVQHGPRLKEGEECSPRATIHRMWPQAKIEEVEELVDSEGAESEAHAAGDANTLGAHMNALHPNPTARALENATVPSSGGLSSGWVKLRNQLMSRKPNGTLQFMAVGKGTRASIIVASQGPAHSTMKAGFVVPPGPRADPEVKPAVMRNGAYVCKIQRVSKMQVLGPVQEMRGGGEAGHMRRCVGDLTGMRGQCGCRR